MNRSGTMNNKTILQSKRIVKGELEHTILLSQLEKTQTNQAIKNTIGIQEQIAKLIKSSSPHQVDNGINFTSNQAPKSQSIILQQRIQQQTKKNNKQIYNMSLNVKDKRIPNEIYHRNNSLKSQKYIQFKDYPSLPNNIIKRSDLTKKSNVNNKGQCFQNNIYSINQDHKYYKQQIIQLKKQKIQLLKKLNEEAQLHNTDLVKLQQMTQNCILLSAYLRRINQAQVRSPQTPINEINEANIQEQKQHVELIQQLAEAKNKVSYYEQQLKSYQNKKNWENNNKAMQGIVQQNYIKIMNESEKQNQEQIKRLQQKIYQLQRGIILQRQGKEQFLQEINFFRHKLHLLENQNITLKSYLKQSRKHKLI